tara:strand:- start:263 stop:1714 length:1452 start_codon:yes stop_codon:yes gene_type:complete
MRLHSSKAIVINDRLLRSWIRCRRNAWLDKYGDKTIRPWSAHKTLQIDHQHRSFIELISKKPNRNIGNCQDGANLVIGLRLFGETPSGNLIKANTSVIQKVQGISKWGNFAYIPVITKQGHRLTRENKLILALNALLLQKLQESETNQAIVISSSNQKLNIENFKISSNLTNQLLESIEKLKKDLNSEEPPPLSSNKRKCSICSWKDVCHSERITKGHLSEVSGIGAKRMKTLHEFGIKDIKDLANSNPIKLQEHLIDPYNKIAKQIINQAIVQINNKEERLNPYMALPELKDAKGIFLYDIESDPDDKHDFLHGFLRIYNLGNGNWNIKKASYEPLLTFEKNNDYFIWKSIKRKLASYPDWPILHYGETESLSLYKLAKRNNSKEDELINLRNRCIDIHSRIKQNWILPINNYGLKTVSNYLGFKWKQEKVDGAKALLWWRQWQNSKRSSKIYSNNINKIFEYNRDDCLATWAIASWLLKAN